MESVLLVGQNGCLDLFALFLGLLDLLSVLVLNLRQLFNEILGMLRSQVVVLCGVLGAACESENIGVECRQIRLNMVEKEGLGKMRPVDLEWYFLKEVVNVQVVLSDVVNDEPVLHWHLAVQRECFDGTLGKSEALQRVEAIVRLIDIINNHDRIREVLIDVDKAHDVGI